MNFSVAVRRAIKGEHDGVTDGKRRVFFRSGFAAPYYGQRVLTSKDQIGSWGDTEIFTVMDFLHDRWRPFTAAAARKRKAESEAA